MSENDIARVVVHQCFDIHQQFGLGLLEYVYEEMLCYELNKAGLFVERQKWIPLRHHDLLIPNAFRADLIVEDKVLVELKSIDELPKCFHKIVMTYLRLADIHLGLLINFKVDLMKEGIRRVVNNL